MLHNIFTQVINFTVHIPQSEITHGCIINQTLKKSIKQMLGIFFL